MILSDVAKVFVRTHLNNWKIHCIIAIRWLNEQVRKLTILVKIPHSIFITA